MTTNRPPKAIWFRLPLACGTVRQKLFIDGKETPFFIDTASTAAHRTTGEKHGLFGSGMGPLTRAGYRIAGQLAAGGRIAPLKHRAEQMALAD